MLVLSAWLVYTRLRSSARCRPASADDQLVLAATSAGVVGDSCPAAGRPQFPGPPGNHHSALCNFPGQASGTSGNFPSFLARITTHELSLNVTEECHSETPSLEFLTARCSRQVRGTWDPGLALGHTRSTVLPVTKVGSYPSNGSFE